MTRDYFPGQYYYSLPTIQNSVIHGTSDNLFHFDTTQVTRHFYFTNSILNILLFQIQQYNQDFILYLDN